MGCSGSKVDDLPLVTLCRERKNLIRAASENRYALAAAHISYFQSLASVGEALCKFVEEELVIGSYPSSPVLTLPSDERKPRRSSGKVKNSSSATSITHSASHHVEREANGSHLQLSGSDSDSDSDLSSHSGHIHVHDSPPVRKAAKPRNFPDPGPSSSYDPSYPYPPPYQNPYPNPNPNPYPYPTPYPYPYSNPQGEWGMPNVVTPEISEFQPRMYYMKKSATPMKSVIFEEPVRYSVGENENWSRYENSGYPMSNGGEYYGYPVSNGGSGYGISNGREQQKQEQPPPAPPSPPRVSPWEYLNVFETYGTVNAGYYPPGSTGSRTSSPDSAEVREREGIPDLEDETETEIMKVVYKDRKKKGKNIMQKKNFNNIPSEVPLQRNFEGPSNFGPSNFASQQNEGYDKVVPSMDSESSHPTFAKEMESISSEEVRSKGSARKGVSFEVEEAQTEEIESMKPTNVTTLSANGTRELQEVVQEIKDEFETAYGYGKEVAFLLEVGKLPYQSKDTLLRVLFSRIMYLVAPSMVSSEPPSFEPSIRVSPRTMKMAKAYSADAAKDELTSKSGNISSSLEKLYVWERKLHKEVKDEEKLRVVYMKQCKKLKSLDEKGAEAAKIDATRESIRNLHTKINVSLRTVNAISNRIHKVRDEELQPQLIELIHGLIRMWRSMFKCHQKQFQAIMESKASSLRAKSESSLQATLELELELLNWSSSFNQWVTTQRSYVESLNEWLLRCLNREPEEETPDGVPPFSPSRMGAPPIFVICNDWFQAMERISQERVSNAMREFASRLHELWERQDENTVSNELEKQLRVLRMEKNGKLKFEKNNQDAGSDKTVVSHLDDLKVDLDSMREKMEEERERHKEAVKLVRGSSSVKSGLVPIFETLGRFSSEVLEGYEHVRIGS